MAHERPTGASEEEIQDLSYAGEGYASLDATEATIRQMLEPHLAKIRPLQAALGEVKAHRSRIEHKARGIEREIGQREYAERQRAAQAYVEEQAELKRERAAASWKVSVDSAYDQVNFAWERLAGSDDLLVHDISSVVGKVLGSPDFVNQLPNLMEGSVDDAVTRTSNEGRIRVRTDEESCRLLLLRDGNFGVLYNPEPASDEGQAVSQIASGIMLPKGQVVNPHVFGVFVDSQSGASSPFVASMRDSFQGPRFTPHAIPLGVTEISAPLRSRVHEILANGDIQLPKRFGKASIPHNPTA